MGVDLIGHGGFSLNWHGWHSALELAKKHGWEPAGTVLVKDQRGNTHEGEWSGTYDQNDFQEVTAADAMRLADALDRALLASESFEDQVTDARTLQLQDAWERLLQANKKQIDEADKRLQQASKQGDPQELSAACVQFDNAFQGLRLAREPDESDMTEWDQIVRDNAERWRQRVSDLIGYCRKGGFLIG